jgi:hypothetical protein
MRNKIAIVVSSLTVLVTVVSAILLYTTRRQNISPIAPESSSASTTVNHNDSFGASLDMSTWETIKTVSTSTSSVSAGKLLMLTSPSANNSQTHTRIIQPITGDFSIEVDVSDFMTSSATIGSAVLYVENNSAWSSVYWDKLTNSVKMNDNTGNILVGTATSIKLKLTRIGSVVQGFVDKGTGYLLVSSIDGAFVADGKMGIGTHNTSATGDIQASFDNFVAKFNLASGPIVPPPGQQCTLSFTVLPVLPTNTPTPTPTVTPTPTPTPTGVPGVTPTPTPTVTPTPTSPPANSCGGTCGSNYNCAGGMFCYQGFCRSPQCPTSPNCVCSQPTNTPTPTGVYVPGPTNTLRPTPVILQEAGSVETTVTAIVGGLILLGIGSFIWMGL